MARRVRPVDLRGMFWRSFFIQASWSYDRMQSLGFAFTLVPALRRLYQDRRQYAARLIAHMEYFNTHPYMASFILGAVAWLEEDRALSPDDGDGPGAMKKTLMAPLGAVGDSFFWGSFKPFVSVLSAGVLLGGALWAPVLFLVLYNIVHIGSRCVLLDAGYRMQGDVMALLTKFPFIKTAHMLKMLALAVIGTLVGTIASWDVRFRPPVPLSGAVMTAVAFVAVVGGAALFRLGGTPVKLMLGLAVLCMLLALGGI